MQSSCSNYRIWCQKFRRETSIVSNFINSLSNTKVTSVKSRDFLFNSSYNNDSTVEIVGVLMLIRTGIGLCGKIKIFGLFCWNIEEDGGEWRN